MLKNRQTRKQLRRLRRASPLKPQPVEAASMAASTLLLPFAELLRHSELAVCSDTF